jgi:hypothetical protein
LSLSNPGSMNRALIKGKIISIQKSEGNGNNFITVEIFSEAVVTVCKYP